jgi:hypothetical protein
MTCHKALMILTVRQGEEDVAQQDANERANANVGDDSLLVLTNYEMEVMAC